MAAYDFRKESIIEKVSKPWKDGDLEIVRVTICIKERTLVNPRDSTCI